MKALAFDNMALEELVLLREEMDKLVVRKQKERNKDIRSRMNALALGAGFDSLEGFIESQSQRKKERSDKGKKLPPKYRHPKNPDLLWSGRGPAPKWILEHEAKGGSRDDWKLFD